MNISTAHVPGCVAKNHVAGKVYVTDYGTCYHSDLACSGLKRTNLSDLLEETGGKEPVVNVVRIRR